MAINDPRDIPGLVAWYSADAETGHADGAQMTQWTDLSGNGNHAIAGTATSKPTWHGTGGQAGGPVVRFPGSSAGSGHFRLPDLMTGAAAGEVMVSLKFAGDNNQCELWALGPLTVLSQNYVYDGMIYENFGRSPDRVSYAPGVVVTEWRRYNVSSAPGAWSARVDGVQRYADANATVAWPSTPAIGIDGYGSLRTTLAWKGDIGVFLLYSRALTTTERSDLDAWLVANPSGGSAPSGNALTLAATAPAATAAFTLETQEPPPPVVEVALAATAAPASGAFALDVPVGEVSIMLAGSAPAASASFALAAAVPVDTSTRYANDGYNYDGTAAVYFEPPIAETPAHIRRVKVMQVHQSMSAPNLVNGVPR